MSRRSFIRNAAIGGTGAALMPGGSKNASAAAKDSGEVTLDALLISYVSPPLGTVGTSLWTPLTPYTTTLTVRSLANQDISLRARVAPDQESINGRAVVAQTQSERIEGAITVFTRPRQNESFSTETAPPGLPENAVFFGLHRPILKFKGNGRKSQFRLVDAEASFTLVAKGIRDFFTEDTANSILRQYVNDAGALIEPRFVLRETTDGGRISITQVAERRAPQNITATVTARIIEQVGFESDILKQAFAVGSNLEITYYSAAETRGEILQMESNLERSSPGLNSIYWDRVFKTFVITDTAS
ncbi:MAG TPA: hypothetical protein VLU47_16685 [Blastocatellia bacterium]|nr:hypothetical protein [Blastocatellia bacterium]